MQEKCCKLNKSKEKYGMKLWKEETVGGNSIKGRKKVQEDTKTAGEIASKEQTKSAGKLQTKGTQKVLEEKQRKETVRERMKLVEKPRGYWSKKETAYSSGTNRRISDRSPIATGPHNVYGLGSETKQPANALHRGVIN